MLPSEQKLFTFTSNFIIVSDIIEQNIDIVKCFLKKYQGFCFSLKSLSELFIIIMIIKERLIFYEREQIKDNAQDIRQNSK